MGLRIKTQWVAMMPTLAAQAVHDYGLYVSIPFLRAFASELKSLSPFVLISPKILGTQVV